MSDRTLESYCQEFEGLICRWDNARLSGQVDSYNHPNGELVSGFEMPQWISMECTQCHYQWSLAKLPILREHIARRFKEVAHDETTRAPVSDL